MIIDDEIALGRSLSRVLARDYDVEVFSTAEAALRRLRPRREEVRATTPRHAGAPDNRFMKNDGGSR